MTSKIRMVLIDLSGTLHVEDAAIPGAVHALNRLRASGLSFKFVTNTTKESLRALHERLTKLGFDINRNEVFTSLVAAKDLIVSRNLNPMLLVDDAALEDLKDLAKDCRKDAVLVGLAPEKFHYGQLNDAFRLLMEGAPLIGIHAARYYKRADGLALGPGPFVKGLEYAANVPAEIVGKPTGAFFQAALSGTDPQNAVMIGDDVRDDIMGAQAIGIRGILVKTGKYRRADEETINPPPTKVCDSFAEAVEFILADDTHARTHRGVISTPVSQ